MQIEGYAQRRGDIWPKIPREQIKALSGITADVRIYTVALADDAYELVVEESGQPTRRFAVLPPDPDEFTEKHFPEALYLPANDLVIWDRQTFYSLDLASGNMRRAYVPESG